MLLVVGINGRRVRPFLLGRAVASPKAIRTIDLGLVGYL
jgi:hypothetical protein